MNAIHDSNTASVGHALTIAFVTVPGDITRLGRTT